MTIQEIHDLINNNPIAKACANAGNDYGAWEAIQADLPKVPKPGSFYTELGIFTAFSTAEEAEVCLTKLETIAESNPLVKRIMKWMAPGTSGVDFGDIKLREALDSMVGALTQLEVDSLKSLGETKEYITVDQVTEAWNIYRIGV